MPDSVGKTGADTARPFVAGARTAPDYTPRSTKRRKSEQPVVTDGKAGMGERLWFKRRLLMASVSTGLVSGLVFASPADAAQDEETNV
ncbi:hypothetical protein, partial [Bradyrhizobium guangdongense]|uniref:hypothetical protein n=1 Tax=Bradyrhizobium guangdongense TaxID=1325090 RepID=UPI003D9A6F3E